MDTRELNEKLKEELTCSICLDYFTNPVTIRCGHNFCTPCLLRCMQEAADKTPTCPVCHGVIQKGEFVLNKNLHGVSLALKMLNAHLLENTVVLNICEQHGEKEKLFCEEDQRLFCETCLLGPEHKDHRVLPFQRAIRKCNEKLLERQRILQAKEHECDLALKGVRRRRVQCEEDAQLFQSLLTSQYEKLHQFLWEEENQHKQKLQQELRHNEKQSEDIEVALGRDIQSLQKMTLEIQENLGKEPLQMLQAMKDTLQSSEELPLGRAEVVSFNWPTCHITGLRDMLLNFHRDITLDPETANAHLILSKDLKRVKYSSVPRDLADNEERFDCFPAVLGAQTFTSGKHYWEVEVGEKTEWEVGIYAASIKRKGRFPTSPEHLRCLRGVHNDNDFFIWNSQDGFQKMAPIHKLGIFLDYEEGHTAFYNATDNSLIYSLPKFYYEEPLRPYFCPHPFDEARTPGSLTICPRPNQNVAV